METARYSNRCLQVKMNDISHISYIEFIVFLLNWQREIKEN
jgi:hypothetical protein